MGLIIVSLLESGLILTTVKPDSGRDTDKRGKGEVYSLGESYSHNPTDFGERRRFDTAP